MMRWDENIKHNIIHNREWGYSLGLNVCITIWRSVSSSALSSVSCWLSSSWGSDDIIPGEEFLLLLPLLVLLLAWFSRSRYNWYFSSYSFWLMLICKKKKIRPRSRWRKAARLMLCKFYQFQIVIVSSSSASGHRHRFVLHRINVFNWTATHDRPPNDHLVRHAVTHKQHKSVLSSATADSSCRGCEYLNFSSSRDLKCGHIYGVHDE